MIALLHIDHSSHSGLSHFLSERLGRFGEFIDEVLIHGFTDTLKLVLFLFLTYLFMEFIEHKASDKLMSVMTNTGKYGPVIGGVFGVVPQCGFSAAAANLYSGRVITLGTLIAVFLSTSDEMLPIIIAGNMKIGKIMTILIYKCAVAIAVGCVIDLIIKLKGIHKDDINIEEICDEKCHCEDGIVISALRHTGAVSLFVFIVTVAVNALLFIIGEDALFGSWFTMPVISHILSSLVGLVPNCASSVALTKLAMSGVISAGAMMSGLFSGAGVGLLVLFRMNKHPKQNMFIIAILLITGVAFGILADIIGVALV